ncbi:hypothetical protein [Oceanobacillus sp. CF4.6]|uniref:hypothetical protein n=1 Tax=Oceanobacillus sp. CF4.6 TaxID=3373080 RepID=UPI003EE5F532
MKHHEAKKKLKYALANQKTISIPKLEELLKSMNISLKEDDNREVEFLKSEMKKLRKYNKRLKRAQEVKRVGS